MKDGYTRDFQTSRTIKLYQKLIDKTKNGKNVPSTEGVFSPM